MHGPVRMKIGHLLIVLPGIVCSAFFIGCSGGGDETDIGGMVADRRCSIVLLTLDTFRADHLSCVNDSAPPTPTLDSLAAEGVRFTDALAASNCTNPSHVSIMSGLYCFAHRVYGNSHGLSHRALTIAEALKSEGYTTIGSVSIPHLNPLVSNLDQGFDYFLPSGNTRGESADERTRAVLEFLRQRSPEMNHPRFIWIHYFDPHTPYEPPPPFAAAYPTGKPLKSVPYEGGMGRVPYDGKTKMVIDPTGQMTRYRGEIAFLDSQLRRLFHGLRELPEFESMYTVVVGDHGEGMGEHGFYFQHASMFREVIRVPLIITGPLIPAGRIVHRPVSTVDIFPTILRLAGRDTLPFSHGKSLLPLMVDPGRRHHDAIVAESVGDWVKSVWTEEYALIWNDPRKPRYWKLPGRIVLVDRGPVEMELADPPGAWRSDVNTLRSRWRGIVQSTRTRYERYTGEADFEALRALGYVR